MSAAWDGEGCPPEELRQRDLEGETTDVVREQLAVHLESCPSCRAWREEARKDDELAVELQQLYADRTRIEAPWGPGAHVGEFELLRRLGDGGMGVVYEALQSDPRRRVAVKLLRAGLHGPEALWRFRHEAQVLGRLQHPGIAQVYRAGTVEIEGRQQPFLAMELVEGRRLDEHAIVRGDDVPAKLALFRELCDAVHHAHLRGVVHRDLKPGNVLVDAAGHPKVLDFGIAQWSAEDGGDQARLTRAGQILGTLPYMSPEQVQGDPDAVDVRSDVYALGVILFEILTGQLPHALAGTSTTEAIRRIVDDEAPRLGTVRRDLRGELDWIAAKALAKDPARRYPSAAALGDDLRRLAAHEPIAARPPSAAYLAAKLLRRHRAPVIGAALVFVALAIGLTTTYLQAERARGAERESSARRLDAEREAALAKAVSSYLERFLGAVDVQRGGKPEGYTVVEALREASASLDAELADRPLVRAHVRIILGGSFRALGQLEQARRELVEGHRLRVEHLGPRHPETAAAVNGLAVLRLQEGDHEGACQLLQEVLQIYRETVGYDNPNTCATLINLSSAYRSRGDDQRALETLVEAERVARRVLGDDHVQVAYCLSHRAELARTLDGDAAAEPICRAALDLYLAIHGERHLEVASEQLRLAEILMARGTAAPEAEALCAAAIATFRAFHATPRPELGEALERLGRLLTADGRNEQAVPVLRDAVEVTRGLAKPDAIALGVRCQLYGAALRRVGRDDDALAALEEAAGIYAASDVRGVGRVAIHRDLAQLHERYGRHRDARRELERALELLARVEPPEERTPAASYSLRGRLAAVLLQLGEFELAEAAYRALLDEGGPGQGKVRHNLALALTSLGRHAEAEAIFRQLLDDRIAASGPDAASLAVLHYSLGKLLVDTDRCSEAEPQLARARALWAGEAGEGSPNALLAAAALADVERRLGRRDQAERTYRSIAGPFAEAFPADHWRHDAFAGAQAALLYELHRDAAAADRLRVAHAALVAKLGDEHREARFLEQRLKELDLGR